MNTILDTIDNNSVDYSILPLYIRIEDNTRADVHIVIPTRGRGGFLKAVLCSLYSIRSDSDFSITVVEHSHRKELSDIAYRTGANYIHIPCDKDEPFNKCLCMNVGVFFGVYAPTLLFHDSDLMVNPWFLDHAIENMRRKETEAVQTFFDRRVLFCNRDLTEDIVSGDIENVTGATYGVYQKEKTGEAPGGSIMVSRELFFKVGGFDPELFHSYSPEDLFFWDKMSLYTKVGTCDDPKNEVYHLDHPLQQNNNPDFKAMTYLYKEWDRLPETEKRYICEYKQKLISKYI